jgi:ketosteroid isomerase-like protein
VTSQNLETVRTFIACVNAEELDAALSVVAPDAELDWSRSEAPDGGTHQGHEAWRAWMSSRWEGLNGAQFEVAELIDLPHDRALLVAHMRGTGRASGLEIAALGAGVVSLDQGKITRITLYQSKDEALAALGLQ